MNQWKHFQICWHFATKNTNFDCFVNHFFRKEKTFGRSESIFIDLDPTMSTKKTRKISKKSQKRRFWPKIRVSPIFCWSYDFETMRKRLSTSKQVYIGHWMRLETDLVYPYTHKMRNSHVCSDIRCYTSNTNYLEILV